MRSISVRLNADQIKRMKGLQDRGINFSDLLRYLFDEWSLIQDDLVSPASKKLILVRQIDSIDAELHELESDAGYRAVLLAKPDSGDESSSLLDKVTELYYLAEDEDGSIRISKHNLGVTLKHGDNELLVKQSYRDSQWTFDSWLAVLSALYTGSLKDEHIDKLIDIAATNSAKTSNPYQIKRTEAIRENIEELRAKRTAKLLLL